VTDIAATPHFLRCNQTGSAGAMPGWTTGSARRSSGVSIDALFRRGKFMTRLIALLLIAGSAVLAGCNTMAGAGQDISSGGHAITNSAEEAK
jgi:entericidin B